MTQDSYQPSWKGGGESIYRTRSAVKGLPWWILAAVVLSVALHILAYYAVVELPLGNLFVRDSQIRPWDRPKERIQISPDLLKDIPIVPDLQAIEPERPQTDITMIDKTLDLLEAQENMPDKEIKLTPEVGEITNFLKGEEGVAAPAALSSAALVSALESASPTGADVFESDVSDLKASMLAKGAVSENQLLLDVSEMEEDSTPPDEELFNSLSKAEVASTGGVRGLEGFNTLDDLLGRAGKLPGNLEPVLMPTDLLFAYGEENLRGSARLSLMKLGLLIQKNPDSEFIIEGHTDSFGSDDFNLALSQRRAAAVRDWLLRSLRLPASGIRIRGFGETRPLVDPSGSQEEQALNRRVEIVIRPKQ